MTATIAITSRRISKNRKGTDDITARVYRIIKRRSGRIRACDLDRVFGDKGRVRLAITRLTTKNKIKRIKGLGNVGIEYYYHVVGLSEISE